MKSLNKHSFFVLGFAVALLASPVAYADLAADIDAGLARSKAHTPATVPQTPPQAAPLQPVYEPGAVQPLRRHSASQVPISVYEDINSGGDLRSDIDRAMSKRQMNDLQPEAVSPQQGQPMMQQAPQSAQPQNAHGSNVQYMPIPYQ